MNHYVLFSKLTIHTKRSATSYQLILYEELKSVGYTLYSKNIIPTLAVLIPEANP